MNVKLNFVSYNVACKLNEALSSTGICPENRVVVLSPTDETTTQSGIIIPGTAKEDLPRKGVVVQAGPIDELNKYFKDCTQIGMIITYGLYAGKELELQYDLPDGLSDLLKTNRLTVLSVNEIIYSECNKL